MRGKQIIICTLVLTALLLCAGAVSAASISDVGSTITVQNMINTDISNFIGQLNSQGGLIVKEGWWWWPWK
jgi:hypothetical protein